MVLRLATKVFVRRPIELIKILIIFFAISLQAFVMPDHARADFVTMKSGPVKIAGITVSTAAAFTVAGREFYLTTVGAGVLSRTFAISPLREYVAQLMVSDPSRFVKTSYGALASIDDEQSIALRLDFLSPADAGHVKVLLMDGLAANKVDAKDTDIVQFLSTLPANGGLKVWTIFITKNGDGSETLVCENSVSGTNVIIGKKGLSRKILSIWLGELTDANMVDLKNQLLQ